MLKGTLLGRFGEAQEIAKAVAFLSEDATYTTGAFCWLTAASRCDRRGVVLIRVPPTAFDHRPPCVEHVADERRLMAYAAGVQDDNPRLFDLDREGGSSATRSS